MAAKSSLTRKYLVAYEDGLYSNTDTHIFTASSPSDAARQATDELEEGSEFTVYELAAEPVHLTTVLKVVPLSE